MASIQELIQANEPRLHQRDFAEAQDECDELRHFRDEFIFPTKADLKRKTLKADESMWKLTEILNNIKLIYASSTITLRFLHLPLWQLSRSPAAANP